VAVTLNVLSTPYELSFLLADSDACVFITQPALTRRFEEIRNDLPLCRHLLTTEDLKRIATEGPFTIDIPDIAPDDPAVMIYTSGLTGKPLGAMLTHHNLLTQSALLKTICSADETFRGLAVIPHFHSFGAVGNMLSPMWVGAGVVLMERFTLDSIFKAIEKEKVTYIAAVPRLFMGMVFHDKADQYDMSSLNVCITGGSTMPPEFIPLFREKFGVLLVEGYGLTEASPVCSVGRLDMPVKPGSIGIPIPGVRAGVVDEAGRELPTGGVGELVIRGDNVMKGYYKDPEMTARVIRDGWLHTGDLARIDEDGYIFLTGRIKRMVITSGFNVYPVEVETVLNMHPSVQASRIEGKPDLLRGEIVKALIVPMPGVTPDEKAIMKHCRTYLSSYKIPREIEFVDKIE
jgi:long-chain acyl-CoA synthetase